MNKIDYILVMSLLVCTGCNSSSIAIVDSSQESNIRSETIIYAKEYTVEYVGSNTYLENYYDAGAALDGHQVTFMAYDEDFDETSSCVYSAKWSEYGTGCYYASDGYMSLSGNNMSAVFYAYEVDDDILKMRDLRDIISTDVRVHYEGELIGTWKRIADLNYTPDLEITFKKDGSVTVHNIITHDEDSYVNIYDDEGYITETIPFEDYYDEYNYGSYVVDEDIIIEAFDGDEHPYATPYVYTIENDTLTLYDMHLLSLLPFERAKDYVERTGYSYKRIVSEQ